MVLKKLNRLPDNYTITVSFTNSNGVSESISRTFIVLGDGESDLPAFEASASASPSPIATPSATPDTRTTMPSTSSGVPKTGVTLPTFLLLIGGILVIIIGSTGLILVKRY